MSLTFDQAFDALSSPFDLFKIPDGTPEHKRERAEVARYRALAKALHPDTATDKKRAPEAFQRLEVLWRGFLGSLSLVSPSGKTYLLHGNPIRGSVANLYWALNDTAMAYVKVVRSPKNSDLLRNEAKALTAFKASTVPNFEYFYPSLIDSFVQRDSNTHALRQTNVISSLEGFYTLAQVHEAYPVLHPKDAVWMWRRLLYGIGAAAQSGIVHGAVLPDNVMIHPSMHGVALVGWSYSVELGQRLKATVASAQDFYPPDKDKAVDESLDIAMTARVASWLMGSGCPAPMKAFIRGCTLDKSSNRPHDAWAVLAELDDLIFRLWGKRKYRAFSMPERKTN